MLQAYWQRLKVLVLSEMKQIFKGLSLVVSSVVFMITKEI